MRSWLRPGRALAGGTAALVAVPALLVLARAEGFPATRPDLAGGGAWLASAAQGAVTLIDGASEHVVGSVRAPGAQAGDPLSVVQAGSSAYVVNPARGTVSRVDGGTYETSDPVQFGTPGGELSVFAGESRLYIVDGARRIASITDPVSLRVRETRSMAAQPGPGQSVVDGQGRLWAVDRNGRGLTWFGRDKRVRPEVGTADARLVLVQGRPVLVEPLQGRLGWLDDDGQVQSWSCLDVRAGDQLRLLGSATSPRVFAVIPATGTLVAAGLGGDDCAEAVSVGLPGNDFGPLAQSDRFVFVPNRTTGRTTVVDTAAGRIAADMTLLGPGRPLELTAKDGLVFYNDAGGDRAGVIRFDGQQWLAGAALTKYRVGAGGLEVLAPGGQRAKPAEPGAKQPDKPAGGGQGGRPGQQPPNQQPDDPAAAPPVPQDPGTTAPPPGGPGGPTNPQPGGGQPTLRVTASKTNPLVGEVVALRVAAQTGPNPTAAHWTFGDGQTADGLSTRHSWAGAGTYPVKVQATFADGRSAEAAVSIRVASPATGRLTVQLAGAGTGTVTSEPAGISCPPTCAAEFRRGTAVTLTAAPAASATFAGWSEACTGAAATCEVPVNGPVTVGAGFTPRFGLTVTAPSGGRVTGSGINCPPDCTAIYDAGQAVTLTAEPEAYFDFLSWGSACGGTGNCALTMDGPKEVSAAFQDTAAPEDCITYDPTNLTIEDLGATGFRLNSGSLNMKLFDTQADAEDGRSMARGYSQQCFIGRGTAQLTQYWKGGSGRPGPVSPEDCVGYNPDNLTIEQNGDLWQLLDGGHAISAFTAKNLAVRGLRLASEHTSHCFIGRDNPRPDRERYITEYWP